MATAGGVRLGRCTNIGNCDLADRRETIEVKPGSDFFCPEPDCGKPLLALGGDSAKTRSGKGSAIPAWAPFAAIGVAVVLFGGFVLSRCTPASGIAVSSQTLLRLGGSNTIGDKLGPALAEGWMKNLGCDGVEQKHPSKDETVLSCTANGKRLAVTVSAHGTKTGFGGLKDGKYDLAMASDKMDDDTASNLSALGDMNSAAAEHVIGFDGVAVIVNRGNPLSQLTLRQVAELFSGEASDWSQVGGASGPVHVFTRDKNSGTRQFFERVVLKGNSKTLSTGAREFEKGTDLSDAVASDPGGIGFVGVASAEVAKPLAIQAAEGGASLMPSPLTIRAQDYALSRRLYLYVPPKHTSSEAAQFLAFIGSRNGEEIVEKSGFTPLSIVPVPVKLPANAPPAYVAATADANRLTFNFFFKTNSSDLDNLGVSDLQRVAKYLGSQHVAASRLMLIGFTDNKGGDRYNIALSVRRAQSVAEMLQTSGVKVGSAIGFGPALPIATNETDEGRNQNRRVEVWIKP